MNELIEQMKAVAQQVRGNSWGTCRLDVSQYSCGYPVVTFIVYTQRGHSDESKTLELALESYKFKTNFKTNKSALIAQAESLEASAAHLRNQAALC
jgi:hypothetical protein